LLFHQPIYCCGGVEEEGVVVVLLLEFFLCLRLEVPVEDDWLPLPLVPL
jgi:hypothetical protein